MARDLEPPPSPVALVSGNQLADATWKTWLDKLRVLIVSNFSGSVNTGVITGDTTLGEDDYVVYCDTDGGAITITLPSGISGRTYRIINTGSSTNDVTITPDGTDLLIGLNASDILFDSEVLVITYEETEGWW